LGCGKEVGARALFVFDKFARELLSKQKTKKIEPGVCTDVIEAQDGPASFHLSHAQRPPVYEWFPQPTAKSNQTGAVCGIVSTLRKKKREEWGIPLHWCVDKFKGWAHPPVA
jgi:hypothetical protein